MAMNRVVNIVLLQIKDHVVKCLCIAYSLVVVGRGPGDHYRFPVLPVHFVFLAGYNVHVLSRVTVAYIITWQDPHS